MSWFAGQAVFREYLIPLLDILLLSYLIYKAYQIVAQTRAVQLFKGALVMGLIYLVAFFLRLNRNRKENGCQDSNNRDDNQQFDQCESFPLHLHASRAMAGMSDQS